LVEEFQPERNLSHSPLFQVMFVLQNAPMETLELSGLTLTPIVPERSIAKFDLTLLMEETTQGLEGTLEFNTDLFESATIRRMVGHFQTLLHGIVENPLGHIQELPLLTDAEYQQLMAWNDTAADYHQDKCIHQLFETQVKQTPETIAVVFEDRQLTYQELNTKANCVAHYLQTEGVKPEVVVGIYIERSFDMLIGLLGILKAGGAYLPLEPTYPKTRLAFILEETRIPVLLTQSSLKEGLPSHKAQVVCLDNENTFLGFNSENPLSGVTPLNLAYVIYTSGSTGQPKGVAIEHRSTVVLLNWAKEIFTPQQLSYVLASTSICFDLSVFEIFVPLSWGGSIILVENALYLATASKELEVTLVNTVPSAMAELVRTDSVSASVQVINLAGEALKNELVQQIYQQETVQQVFNLYGPSEDTTYSTFALMKKGDTESPTIGCPIANTQIYILDRHLQLTPIGVPGELHIGGTGLARYYLNRPDLTAENFIPNPFNNELDSRFYKTGDLARYLPNGNIEYLGRLDNQVKIRGFRIELGEIEAVLAQHPDVRENVVLVVQALSDHKHIKAYIVSNQAQFLDNTSLRGFLQEKLPDYMIPSAFVRLETMPLTPNGKIDRRALLALESEHQDLEIRFVAPRTSEEERLVEIWVSVLGRKSIGIHDNFFELGGDSILSIQVISRANHVGLQLKPKHLFQYQTIAELAAIVTQPITRQIDQGLVTGKVPVTPIQHWFFEQKLPHPHHFNQAVLLEVSADMTPKLLEPIVSQLLQHHDALRLRFTKNDEQLITDNASAITDNCLLITDLSEIEPCEQHTTIEAIASELQTSLSLSEGPLLRVALFYLGHNSPNRLLFIVHHFAVDGVSWRILLEDFATAYQQMSHGKAIVLPPKTTSFKQWAESLTEYAQSELLTTELDYWLDNLLPFKVVSLPVDYPSTVAVNTRASKAQLSVFLSEQDTRALLFEVPPAYHTQINDVLLTALAQTFTQWTGNSTCFIDLEGHGREGLFEDINDIDLSRTVGWFTSICPVLLDIGTVSKHHGELLKSIKEQLRRIPNQGIGYGLLKYLNSESATRLQALPQAQILFNYLGQFHQVLSERPFLGVAQEKIGATQSFLGNRRYLFEINAILHNKQLQIDWSYSKNCHQQSTIERLAQDFIATLLSLIAHCQSPEAGGYTSSDFPLASLSQATLDRILVKRQVHDLYPLSPMQEGLLFHTLYAPESGVYFEQFHFTLEGELNLSAFQQAWQQIINRHTILRTGFVWEGLEKPAQIVYKQVKLPWVQLDWRELTTIEQQKRLVAFLTQDKKSGFDLTKAPLMRCTLIQLADEIYNFIWSFHHILLDGWCLSIIFKEVQTNYEAFCQEKIPRLEQPRPYREYIAWLQQQDISKAKAFWTEQLKGFMAPTPFQVDNRTDNANSQKYYKEQRFALSKTTTEALQSYVRQHHLTLNTLVQGAWALLLNRYSFETDVVFGATVSGRPAIIAGVESMVGLFINTLPVRVQVSSKTLLLPWLQQLHAQQVEREQYSYTPLVDIQGWSDVPASVPLFESIMAFENYPIDSTLREKPSEHLNIRLVHAAEMTNYPLTMMVEISDSKLLFKVLYETVRFTADTIARMMGHVETLLESMVDNPERRLGEFSLLASAERHQLLVAWNNTHTEYPKDQCIHQLFEAQVERTQETIAVLFEDQQLTYQELNQKANQLAYHLQTLGVKPEVLVGICVERSIEMVIGLLGILKAGGAYVPLEPSYPQKRLAFMLEDSQLLLLLTQEKLTAKLPESKIQIICLDTDWRIISKARQENPVTAVGPNNLAYVIYTSGSTGKPKGVQIAHQSVTNFLNAMRQVPGLTDRDILLAVTTVSFDIAVLELYLPLMVGARIMLVSSEMAFDGAQLLDKLNHYNITVMQATPATWRMLLAAGWEGSPFLKILVGGDALPRDLAQQLQEKGAQVWNLYGPTETTVWSANYQIGVAPALTFDTAESIGSPIANTQIYILDQNEQPTSIGIPGELHIGGAGLARGYLNRPDYSSEKFIPNPFSDEPGSRLYKTGDLARYLPDGNIEYLSRLDNQVKIRGFRIELSEIEAVLLQHPLVLEAVLTCAEAQPNDQRLVAYLVSDLDTELKVLDDTTQVSNVEQLSQWEHVWEENYSQSTKVQEPTFNIAGWQSSYTGLAIPEEEMREWVDATVNLILSLQPNRVLEIGCGTGLLLSRIAPHCTQYWGTDFSPAVLQQVEQLKQKVDNLNHVALFNRKADDFNHIEQDSFDTIILNSVIQYFPNVTYLLDVLDKAINAVKPGGTIFVGDVRSLPLLKAYHASVQFYQAPNSFTRLKLQQRIQQRLMQEEELVIDPTFFMVLKQHNPRVIKIKIQPKHGHYHNELTRFRYDVILQVGNEEAEAVEMPCLEWIEWQTQKLTLSTLCQQLIETQPKCLGLRAVPNVRLDNETKILEWLDNAVATETVSQLQKALSKRQSIGIDPDELWQLSDELPYDVEISWINASTDGCYDVLFKSRANLNKEPKRQGTFFPFRYPFSPTKPWHHYANNPLHQKLNRQLVPQLRQFLQEQLPAYMVPSAFVMLEAIPLTPNGKVDRRALPTPEGIRPQLEAAYVKPQTETEQMIATLWQKMLELKKVGIYDNFFDLGGHSLLMVQIQSQLQEVFGQKVSMVELFQYPTISALARHLTHEQSTPVSHQQSQKRTETRRTRKTSMKQQRQTRQKHRSIKAD
jgi:amino acid adenylation domain-containing protein/non-ribosomal peptide synthase protein (TIGR01720 family)